ncbi:MAG: nitrilase-related carbon-nitrogen hydrolase [Rhodospirillaceae bacterium]|nr:nitrilase-related carbon-nitrogen hydrolase [Rhodospirillaceae bacterium]
MLILCQSAWTPRNAKDLAALVGAGLREAQRQSASDRPDVLILLPHAPLGAGKPITEAAAMKAIGAAAKSKKIYLAGSAVMLAKGEKAPQTIGFVVGPDGKPRLRMPKITPDLVEGFAEATSAFGRPNDFPVAKLPFAQVGVLCGEDIMIAPYARSLTFHGAEIILNPCIERSDQHFALRSQSRFGRAGENRAYVATASPTAMIDGGRAVQLPQATALYHWERPDVRAHGGETFVIPDLDMELLRRSRSTPQGSFPAILRADVYGRGYKKWAAAAKPESAPAGRAAWKKFAAQRLAAEAKATGPQRNDYEEHYDVCIVQTVPRLIPLGANNAREIIRMNLEECLALAASRANIPSMRLVVFPEFWLTGPGGIGGIQRTVRDMERVAIGYPDEVFDRIGKFAQDNKVFVAFQNFEVHPKLPGRVFNSAFLIDDAGNLVHTYRKNQCADVWGFLPDTTPGSILDKYLDTFGYDALFPVADTKIGRLANMICFDNMHPEVAFGLRHAGAELILHSSSEPHGGDGRRAWDNARQLRAFENTVYMLSAIDGGEYKSVDSEIMTYFRRGHSRMVNFDGTLQGTVDGPGPVVFRGHIDLTALRRARANPRTNYALWNDPRVYAHHYGPDVGFPSNLWAGDPYENPYLGAKQLRAVIDDYMKRGIYVSPNTEVGLDRYRTSDQV